MRTVRLHWKKKPYAKLRFIGLLLVAIVLIYTFVLWWNVSTTINDLAADRFDQAIDLNSAALTYEFEVYADTLYSGRALFLVKDHVSHADWESYVAAQNINQRYPAVASISYVAALKHDQVPAFLQQVRAGQPAGQAPFRIYPDTGKPALAVLTYRSALVHDDTRLGFDMLSDAARAATLDAARDANAVRASAPLTIQTDRASDIKSMLLTMPVYKSDARSLATVHDRRANLRGYVILAVHIRELLDLLSVHASYGHRIFLTAATNGQTIYTNVPKTHGDLDLQKQVQLNLAGQDWQLTYQAVSGFGTAPIGKRAAPAVLALGALVAALLGIAFYYAIGIRLVRDGLDGSEHKSADQ